MVDELDDAEGTAGGGSVGSMPDPALFAPSGPKHKKHKRHRHEPKADLSINSLLDVLSIILVFLLKSYSASTVVLKPSPDLNPPMSNTRIGAEDSTAVTVTLKDIMIDDKPVVNLDNGKATERDLSHAGMLIEPLFAALQDEVQHQRKIEQRNPKAAFKGIVTIIADRFVPSFVILQVMYTAGLSEFSKFKFLLVKVERI